MYGFYPPTQVPITIPNLNANYPFQMVQGTTTTSSKYLWYAASLTTGEIVYDRQVLTSGMTQTTATVLKFAPLTNAKCIGM